MRSSSDAFTCALNDDNVRSAWPWFFGLGLLLTGLSGLAFTIVSAPETTSIFRVGVLMIFAAAIHSVQSFRVRRWAGFPSWLMSGILYCVAGVFLAIGSSLAIWQILTCGVLLAASGGVRIWSSNKIRSASGRTWIGVSGAATVAAGIFTIVFVWSFIPLWLLTLGLAIDLGMQGITNCALGLALKSELIQNSDHLRAVVSEPQSRS